jgi:uncharacterized tellurite resistance protein B-like protein
MTDGTARRRQGKKRLLATILDAMHRLDAIFPETRPESTNFGALIMCCRLMLADGIIHPLETRFLTRLVAPQIKLRRDDIEFICDRIEDRCMTDRHLEWLISFMQSSMTPADRDALAKALYGVAMADHNLHQAESRVIDQAQHLLGLKPAARVATG